MKDKLIWRWISEGFLNDEKQEASLYELGDCYFNELINRNMILPMDIDERGRVEACRVHDMVLDIICSLSSDENFVAILDGTKQSKNNPDSMVQRLSHPNSMSKLTTYWTDATKLSKKRSLIVFGSDADLIPTLSSFQLLHVLDYCL